MAIYCSACGAQNPDAATFCSACGKPITQLQGSATPSAAAGTPPPAAAMTHNAAAAIAYLTVIPAIILLLVDPYNRDRFVRFHAWQCIWLTVAAIVLRMVVWFLPGLFLFHMVFRAFIGLILFIFWLLAIIHAAQGKIFKIPVIGDMAESQAGKI